MAFTSLGPFISKIIFFVLDVDDFIAKFFTFKTISVTSSLTPFIDENSCNTPSIWIAVTAAPCIDDSKILIIRKDSVDVQDLNGTKLTLIFEEKDVSADTYCLGKYDHYMQKEIYEQFDYVMSALMGRIKDTEIVLGGRASGRLFLNLFPQPLADSFFI